MVRANLASYSCQRVNSGFVDQLVIFGMLDLASARSCFGFVADWELFLHAEEAWSGQQVFKDTRRNLRGSLILLGHLVGPCDVSFDLFLLHARQT